MQAAFAHQNISTLTTKPIAMGKIFMPDASQAERLQVLQNTANKTETGTYIKVLTEEELYARREVLAETAIKLRGLEEKKKEMVSKFKEEMDPVKRSYDDLLLQIRTGQEEKSGETFYMANYTENMMEVYDEQGEMITSRRLRPDEKQGNVFAFDSKRLAANDQ